MIKYRLIRTKRKTVAICVKPDGEVEVRAPHRAGLEFIESFVKQKEDWIQSTRAAMAARRAKRERLLLSSAQVAEVKTNAKKYLTQRCAYFAPRMGVAYTGVKINSAKSRWGSCTAKGSLNFTYRLLFAESELIDYVVVHELAHLREMNHSSRFWAVVEQELPDYRKRRSELREFQRQFEIVEEGE